MKRVIKTRKVHYCHACGDIIPIGDIALMEIRYYLKQSLIFYYHWKEGAVLEPVSTNHWITEICQYKRHQTLRKVKKIASQKS